MVTTLRTLRCSLLLSFALLAGCDALATTEGRTALAACHDTCSDRGLSETDRATCRLSCNEAARIPPFPSAPPALAAAASCLGACDDHVGAAAKACTDACRPPDVAPAVVDQLTTCVAGCRSDAGSADDRATCRLLCAQTSAPAK